MQSKILKTYTADVGSCVINGVFISNGVGDGTYDVIVYDQKPQDIEEIVWLDLREQEKIGIWDYDCDSSTVSWYIKSDFYNADAIGVGVDDNGNICICK